MGTVQKSLMVRHDRVVFTASEDEGRARRLVGQESVLREVVRRNDDAGIAPPEHADLVVRIRERLRIPGRITLPTLGRVGAPVLGLRLPWIVERPSPRCELERRRGIVARDVGLGLDEGRLGRLTRPPGRPSVPQEHVAEIVLPKEAERGAAALLDADHRLASEVLGASIVSAQGVERLGEPPPPVLERRPSGAIELAIAARELAVEQGSDVAPAAPLVVGHVREGDRKQAVGPGEVAADVPHETAQRLAPPPDGAALFRHSSGSVRLAVLQQVTHALSRDPLVPGEGGARLVECRQEPGARLANARGLGGRAVLVVAAVIPITDPTDHFVAPAVRAGRALGEVGPPRGLERIPRAARRREHGERVGRAGLPARDHVEEGKQIHGAAPYATYPGAGRPASLTPWICEVMSAP